MIEAWPVAAVVAAETVLLAQGRDLMAVASWGLARRCAGELQRVRGRVSGAAVLLLVGAGNNGADAMYAGVLLRRRGVAVTALLVAERAHPAGLSALRGAGGRVVRLSAGAASLTRAAAPLGDVDLTVDAILGVGSRGAVRGPAADLLARLTAGDQPRPGVVVACDLPSGIDPDDGTVDGPVLAADVTVSFGVAKPGLLLPPGDAMCGTVEVVPLGLDVSATPPDVTRWEPAEAALRWPRPRRGDDKYARGVLGVVAGSAAYPGAGVLAASAAVAAGAGMVRYAGDPRVGVEVVRASPEVVPDPLPGTGRVQAWLVGPGIGDEPAATDLVAAVIDRLGTDREAGAVVDAGALVAFARAAAGGRLVRPQRLVLTPHAGELATLLGALGETVDRAGVTREPARWARRAATVTGATVLLKGATTIVADPAGRLLTTATGPAWLATAGSGDVLAGVAGALLAAGQPPSAAAALAALVHGSAGRLVAGSHGADGPVRATALLAVLPRAIADLSHYHTNHLSYNM